MNYEQKYKEALELMKDCILDKDGYVTIKPCDIFPELKESEDERMIKFIKNQLFNIKKTITEDYGLDVKLTMAIDWLEKQGEKFIPENINEAALQYVDTCAVDGEITHDNVTEPYWNNHSMMSAYKAGWLEKQASKNV